MSDVNMVDELCKELRRQLEDKSVLQYRIEQVNHLTNAVDERGYEQQPIKRIRTGRSKITITIDTRDIRHG